MSQIPLSFEDERLVKALSQSGGAYSALLQGQQSPVEQARRGANRAGQALNVSLVYGQDKHRAPTPVDIPQDGGRRDGRMAGGRAAAIRKAHAKVVKDIEKAFKKELKKQGVSGGALAGAGFFKDAFDTVKSAGKSAVGALAKAIDVKPSDDVVKTFFKGLKAPFTLGKKLEDKLGIDLGSASKSVGEALVAAGTGLKQPKLIALGGALIAAPAVIEKAGQVIDTVESGVETGRKVTGLGFKEELAKKRGRGFKEELASKRGRGLLMKRDYRLGGYQ